MNSFPKLFGVDWMNFAEYNIKFVIILDRNDGESINERGFFLQTTNGTEAFHYDSSPQWDE